MNEFRFLNDYTSFYGEIYMACIFTNLSNLISFQADSLGVSMVYFLAELEIDIHGFTANTYFFQ